MERTELAIRDRLQLLLQDNTLEEILEMNDMTPEDCLIVLYFEYGIKLPDEL